MTHTGLKNGLCIIYINKLARHLTQ